MWSGKDLEWYVGGGGEGGVEVQQGNNTVGWLAGVVAGAEEKRVA